MRYVIMCGCDPKNERPKQMIVKDGEALVERTIRLLRQAGVEDIAISSRNKRFAKFGVPILLHANTFYDQNIQKKYWVDGFIPTDEPTCYVFGDVFFSDEAIQKIVDTDTDDIEFFASAPPFARNYPKNYAEPFAFKVKNQKHFREAIKEIRRLCDEGKFTRHPISWELWQVIKETRINWIDFSNYTVINDYSCDIDNETQIMQWR